MTKDTPEEAFDKIYRRTVYATLVSVVFGFIMLGSWLLIGWMYYADVRSVGIVLSFFLLTQIVYVLEKGFEHNLRKLRVTSIISAVFLTAMAVVFLIMFLSMGTPPPVT